ncbi:MAG: hypothetical protein EU544_01700 [Promethearchaeota archaeon]|nr:MAG: hypothetical protein EU544_01700 [Candidatus Lokiarchaeota archaeon]
MNYFERQEEIKWLSQKKISSTTIAILGMGGIGTNVAIHLARLGFKKLHLIDYDVVEASNLNRQTLYSKEDIGKKKVHAAKHTLDNLDNLASEIMAHDYDIFQDWTQTIELVKESNFIMNGLDQPEIKRSLIGMLCMKLQTPMIYSGTDPHSGYSGMILLQDAKKNSACYECLQAILPSIPDKNLRKKYNTENILDFTEIDWEELEAEDFTQLHSGATNIITAMLSSNLASNLLLQSLHSINCPNRIIFDLYETSLEKYYIEKRKDCLVCGEML